MKVQYSKEDDILMIELTAKKVDDAYETENMIVHVDAYKEPVLLEIFHATNFLRTEAKALPKELKQALFV